MRVAEGDGRDGRGITRAAGAGSRSHLSLHLSPAPIDEEALMTSNHPHGSGVCEACGHCIIPDCAEHGIMTDPETRVLRAAVALFVLHRQFFDYGPETVWGQTWLEFEHSVEAYMGWEKRGSIIQAGNITAPRPAG
jgi:hypothetical protein